MTSNDSRPFGCAHPTPFEAELVNAMNNFANSADAPTFDAPGITRRSRRKRATAIAAISAALIVAGGGTALASITGGSDASKSAPAAAITAAPAKDAATLLFAHSAGTTIPIDLLGTGLDDAKGQLAKTRTKLGTVNKVDCGKYGKPGTVIQVEPHSPKTVASGDTVNVTLCAG
ncbi:PASTA domain-containing protein [Streptomyces phaeochromogenes]|uniref:PASTA domain-containing protein n=1 Tax=Streptomyces phaeochromogenes TaxID=1923 RepID=A0ABZ1HJ28_STRPH|nr:PASTA domain-containing protein [Streptomyces phaeochromogenes]WSD17531.1 PASTA domain-containing protein [Streptomyces phaeochromogenes]